MEGCVAPSEVPGISSAETSVFGQIAEDLIYADFCESYGTGSKELFRDSHNPSAYLLFLAHNNPHFDRWLQEDYYGRLRREKLGRVPDFIVHKPTEKAFYEVKPDSASGRNEGVEKVGILSAVYQFYKLPYAPGSVFQPKSHTIALLGNTLKATLKVRRPANGLLLYKICLESEKEIELATLVVLLQYIIREINRQKGSGKFRPIDLVPAVKSLKTTDWARDLGIPMAVAGGAAMVRWSHFWKAVVKRFAFRGTIAATLSAADGPLFVGELVSVGIGLWTVVDIIRAGDELWREAEVIARSGA